jgi:hypothetical protein
MRPVGVVLSVFLCAAGPAAAQTPILAVPQAVGPDFGPKTVTPTLTLCTDLPTTTAPMASLRVVAPHAVDLHELSERGDLVVINGGTPQGLSIGQRFFTRRLMPPASREPMGPTEPGSIRTSGWVTIVAADERSSLARIDYGCTIVDSGDYLDPYVEPTLPATIAEAGPTSFTDLGRVLFGQDRRESFGAGDFLSIDRGAARGMVNGARVAFYRDRRNGTPLVELGTGIVVEVSAETSKVVISRANQDIRRADLFGVRGPLAP